MIAEKARAPNRLPVVQSSSRSGEVFFYNPVWESVNPRLSVLVPVFRYDSSRLISALSECEAANEIELILYDDGSADPELTHKLEIGLRVFPGAGSLVTARENVGRSGGRNRLQSLARCDWLLFLDADMIPDDTAFLNRYLRLIRQYDSPVLAVGGFSLLKVEKTDENRLHWQQCEASECVPAERRQEAPGRFVFTSNVLVHRAIMTDISFDDAFKGWGWEDVDWGLRAAKKYTVIHIDNTATHVGLDSPDTLLKKYAGSAANFWLAVKRHPDELKPTGLYKMAKALSPLPGKGFWRYLCAVIARHRGKIIPVRLRLLALKLFRALVYAEAIHGHR